MPKQREQPEDVPVKPEIVAALTAAATAFLGTKARIRSAQLVPGGAGCRRRVGAAGTGDCADVAQSAPEWMSFGNEFAGKEARRLKLQITIDGKAYEVDVEVLEDEESRPEPSNAPTMRRMRGRVPMHRAIGGGWDSGGKVCRSPVTGLVIKVNVKPGQILAAGEQMVVLEAMKMETHRDSAARRNGEERARGAGRFGEGEPGFGGVRVKRVEDVARKIDGKAEMSGVQEELKKVPGIQFVDHVAIAVKQGELEGQVKAYEALGFREIHREEVRGTDQVREALLEIGDGPNLIQLLEPLSADSPVQKLIDKNGGRGGLAHVAFRVRVRSRPSTRCGRMDFS